MNVTAHDVPTPPPSPASPPTPPPPSFLDNLNKGIFRWDLIYPFPAQPEQDWAAGEAFARPFEAFLKENLQPTQVDDESKLPDSLIPKLRDAGYLKMQLSPELYGGLGLSNMNFKRAIELAGSWCSPVALMLIIQNAAGAAVFIPYIQDLATRQKYEQMVRYGALGAIATTEPQGASNVVYQTTAKLTEDGKHYLINGEKLYISNGQVANLFAVGTSVTVDGKPQGTMFMVESTMPGVSITSDLTFMGNHGLYNAAVSFKDVKVPVENMLGGIGQSGNIAGNVLLKARLFFAPTLAVAVSKLSLEWSRIFVKRKVIDGQALGNYQATQSMVGTMAANTYAIESMLDWILLHMDMNATPGAQQLTVSTEQNAAKNFGADTGWRTLDMAYQLLAGVGYETAQSKAARGWPAIPLERFYRDARVQRIFGGTSEYVNINQGKLVFLPYFLPSPGTPPPSQRPVASGLSPRNQRHLDYVSRTVPFFGEVVSRIVKSYATDPLQLFSQELILMRVAMISTELFGMAACLSRAATFTQIHCGDFQSLTDIYCTAARQRIRSLFRELKARYTPPFASISDQFLNGKGMDWILEGVILELPPV